MLKLNLGSGPRQIKGFKNVDALPWVGKTDIIWDLTNIPYSFVTEEVDELVAIEVLEHISFRELDKVVNEWYRILNDGGKLTVQVPDCGRMMEAYVNKTICECVPHKALSIEDYKPNPWCTLCEGRGTVNPFRWQFAFTGAQKHPYDFHRTIFTKDLLEQLLKSVGFEDIEFVPHIYKLIVVCHKPPSKIAPNA